VAAVYSNFAGTPMMGGVVEPSLGFYIYALSLSFNYSDVSCLA